MAYTVTNFKSKKALKEAAAGGKPVEVFKPGLGGNVKDGPLTLEGPHYPEAHKWYASAKVVNGSIVPGSVK